MAALLRDAPKARIGIVGDFALDAYWFIDPAKSAPSLETGHPTNPIREQRYELGGGGNIAANVAALGGKVQAFGVVGDDPWGRELLLRLGNAGVATSGRVGSDASTLLVQDFSWATPVFIKPHVAGAEQSRFDTADFNELFRPLGKLLLVELDAALPELDLLIVNEQIPGSLHTEWFRKQLAGMARRYRGKFIVDSRYHANEYTDAYLRMNDREAVRLQLGVSASAETPPVAIATAGGGRPDRPSRERVVAAAEALFAKAGQSVFVSRGPDGVVIRDASGLHEVPAIRAEGEIDIVGAGDSLLAGISLALALGRDPVTAAELGILAASVTIRKLRRCGTATPEEILGLF